jgi:hypothetical protein
MDHFPTTRYETNIQLLFTPKIDAMKITRSLACAFSGLSITSIAIAGVDPKFFGIWSCTTVHDGNTIDIADWWQERFDDKGVLTEGAQKPTKLVVRNLRPDVYELTYADGGKAQIEMKEPWIFLRHTDEHRFLCLRKSPQ